MFLAPIAVFAFDRVAHLRRTIESLQRNSLANQSELHVFCDAAPDQKRAAAVSAVRDYVARIDGFRSVTIHHQTTNLGLANSIIGGVNELTAAHGKVIVLEDDLLTSPYFLEHMNDYLVRYAEEPQVGAVSGYMYPVKTGVPYFFREVPQSWGWATWQRSWAKFESCGERLLTDLQAIHATDRFNRLGHQPLIPMLQGQIKGLNQSWYVRWAASLFLAKQLTVMPGQSLIQNIGMDGTGTHCNAWYFDPYSGPLWEEALGPTERLPIVPVKPNVALEQKLRRYFFKVSFYKYVNFALRTISRRHSSRMPRHTVQAKTVNSNS